MFRFCCDMLNGEKLDCPGLFPPLILPLSMCPGGICLVYINENYSLSNWTTFWNLPSLRFNCERNVEPQSKHSKITDAWVKPLFHRCRSLKNFCFKLKLPYVAKHRFCKFIAKKHDCVHGFIRQPIILESLEIFKTLHFCLKLGFYKGVFYFSPLNTIQLVQ